ncbi:MAG: hypothetical protein K9N10_21335 [Deltaproteobacteria bacterium]|nr:hypothetical protein [Deltaproteobacteria bacterium]
MTDQTKIVKGGFRSTLALIIALIAIILSYMAYSSSTKDEGLNAQINRLQATMEKIKAESGDQLDKLREETAKTLDKMSEALNMKNKSGSSEEPTSK